MKPRQVVLLQPAWQKQVTVVRNALVAPAVRPADEKTGGRDDAREHLVDRLPEHLERWRVQVGDRRWLRGIVANDVDLDLYRKKKIFHGGQVYLQQEDNRKLQLKKE